MVRPALFLAVLALAACSTDPVSAGADVASEVGCNSCHVGADTDLAPTLEGIWGSDVDLSDGTTVTVDSTYVRRSITDPQADVVAGYEDARMPTFSLSEEEVDQLVEYVRSVS